MDADSFNSAVHGVSAHDGDRSCSNAMPTFGKHRQSFALFYMQGLPTANGSAKGKGKSFQEACAKPLSIIKRSFPLSSSHHSHNSSEDSAKTSESAVASQASQPCSPSKVSRTQDDTVATHASCGQQEKQSPAGHAAEGGTAVAPAPMTHMVAIPAGATGMSAIGGPPSPQELGPHRCRRLADVLLR